MNSLRKWLYRPKVRVLLSRIELKLAIKRHSFCLGVSPFIVVIVVIYISKLTSALDHYHYRLV